MSKDGKRNRRMGKRNTRSTKYTLVYTSCVFVVIVFYLHVTCILFTLQLDQPYRTQYDTQLHCCKLAICVISQKRI